MFGVRQIPYEFDNELLVIVPVLIVVYALTLWIEGKVFIDESLAAPVAKAAKKSAEPPAKGFKLSS